MTTTVVVAMASLVAVWAISYWEAKRTILASLSEKTDLWSEEIGRLSSAARADLAALDKQTQGKPF